MALVRVEQVEWDEAVPAPPVADSVLEDLRANRRRVPHAERSARGIDRQRVRHPIRASSPVKVADATEALAVRWLGEVVFLFRPDVVGDEHAPTRHVDRFVAITIRPCFGVDGFREHHWPRPGAAGISSLFFDGGFVGSSGISASRSLRYRTARLVRYASSSSVKARPLGMLCQSSTHLRQQVAVACCA